MFASRPNTLPAVAFFGRLPPSAVAVFDRAIPPPELPRFLVVVFSFLDLRWREEIDHINTAKPHLSHGRELEVGEWNTYG